MFNLQVGRPLHTEMKRKSTDTTICSKTRRARRVKCDESRPNCLRCTKSGRGCGGYQPRPVGHYKWEELLLPMVSPAMTVMPDVDRADVHALSSFRAAIAPALCFPMDSFFWTRTVMQFASREPAVEQAVLAIEPNNARNGDDNTTRHYNKAIKTMIQSGASLSTETILMVCILFICIEFFRGNNEAALSHMRYGITLINSMSSQSELLLVFRRISIFPYLLKLDAASFRYIGDVGLIERQNFLDNERAAQISLEPLFYRSIRLVRTFDSLRFRDASQFGSIDSARAEQKHLQDELQVWWANFVCLRRTLNLLSQPRLKCALLMLEMRWLVARIWMSTFPIVDETAYDNHVGKFVRIVNAAIETQRFYPVGTGEKLSFPTGILPLLLFTATRCRFWKVRTTALRVMNSLSSSCEALWSYPTMHALAKRVIELEHGIQADELEMDELEMPVTVD